MKERPIGPNGFLNSERPYMKLDIWEPCEIEKKWGHDPATYPSQDLLQHYPEIQFNPGVKCNPAALDSNLNVITVPNQKGAHTVRPGFQNVPVELVNAKNALPTITSTSNVEGVAHSVANTVPMVDEIEDRHGDPATKAYTVRPGFQNTPVELVDPEAKLPVSTITSNEVGIAHAEVNGVPTREGTKAIGGSETPVQPTPETPVQPTPGTPVQPTPGTPATPANPQEPCVEPETPAKPQEPCVKFDGTICEADKVEEAVEAAVDCLMGVPATDDTKTAEELAKEAAALEEAITKANA